MPTQHVQTKREIQALLSAAGMQPRKRFGQHFLIDGNLMRRLVQCAELSFNDRVLEVGPGTGGLTDLLAGCVGQLSCVEIDRQLHALLEERFADREGITLILGDVLKSKHCIRDDVVDWLRSPVAEPGCIKLVSNLPYQSATPLVMNLLVDYPEVRRLCFTVQAEVGERILAPPGGKAYGPLGILAQTLCRVQLVTRIPPQAFWPAPTVDSVMLRLDTRDSALRDREEVRRFAGLVRGAFDHRRKTLRSALGYTMEDRARDRVCERLDAKRRPESFSVEEWMAIHCWVEEANTL